MLLSVVMKLFGGMLLCGRLHVLCAMKLCVCIDLEMELWKLLCYL